MTEFSYFEMNLIRDWKDHGGRMDRLVVALSAAHTRDEIVEAIDAMVREPTLWDAVKRVNRVLAMQAAGKPLVNGREAWVVTAGCQAAHGPNYHPWEYA